MSHLTNFTRLPIHNWLLENISDALLFVDEKGYVRAGNDSAYELLGIEHEEALSIDLFFDFSLLTERAESHALMEIKDESQRLFRVKCLRSDDESGPTIYSLIIQQVTLNENREQMRFEISKSLDTNFEGMILHERGKIIDCDQTFARLFGYRVTELINKSIYDLVEKSDVAKLKKMMSIFPDKPYVLKGIKKDGTTFYGEIMAHPYPDNDKILRAAIIRDITDRVENEKKIEFMAFYDELTDLPNRNFFYNRLNEAIEEAQKNKEKIAIHFMDLDYFKQINDTLGYSFGDKLLQACSNRLKKLLNESIFIARMGGDEFLILQRGIKNSNQATDLAKLVIEIFKEPIKIDDFELFTSVSVGISLFPDNGLNGNDLIKHADAAMYVIKDQQRNHYKLFESSISENFKEMLTLETELRKALKEGQLELYYQPQKNIVTENIIGLEALLRWKHPEKGYISPSTFIPIAEKTGIIFEIGSWVLKEACRQNKEWQNEGYDPLVVSVNLSAKQFHQQDLVFEVQSVLRETGLDARYLELEITESMAMSNEEYIIYTLQGLRDLGVSVSIDDFGTGYSSLMYLSRFPVSKLKIDRVFIHENHKQNEAIVKSIIHMSHSLNLKVIAEGVETIEQLQFLKEEQCDEVQGFYFSKPLPPAKLTQILR